MRCTNRVLWFLAAGWLFTSNGHAQTPGPSPRELGRQVRVEELQWALGGASNVLVIKAKLKNQTSVPLKDFVFDCLTISASGTELTKVQHRLYQALGPGQAKVFSGVTIGLVHPQTHKVGCDIAEASQSD